MTLQQRIWMAGRTLLWAVGPLALYLFMPGLCVMAGMAIRRPNVTVDEFFASSANFYTAAGMAAAVCLLYRRSKRKGDSFFGEVRLCLEKICVKRAVLSAVFGMAASTAIASALTLQPFFAGAAGRYEKAVGSGYGGTDPWFLILSMVFLAPVLEEFIFRGMMLSRLLSWFDSRTAKLLTASLFAFCHADLIWASYAFFMGLILGELTVREDNTAYAIFMHTGFNTPSLVVFFAGKNSCLYEILYGSRFLVALYGMSGFLLCVLLWKWYEAGGRGEAGEKMLKGSGKLVNLQESREGSGEDSGPGRQEGY